jgi:hypothetical protein
VAKKRYRVPQAKPGQLLALFGRAYRQDTPDLVYSWGGSGASKPDSRILMRAIEEVPVFDGRSLREELTARGYDITTLRFSIQRHAEPETPR